MSSKHHTQSRNLTLEPSQIAFNTVSKVRLRKHTPTIERYTERWKEYRDGQVEFQFSKKKEVIVPYPFPPVLVAKMPMDQNGKEYDLISGMHRVLSAEKAEMGTIKAKLVEGAPEELLKMAIAENRGHGLPFSPEDISCCVLAYKKANPNVSIREIAKITGASKSTVGRILQRVEDAEKRLSRPGQIIAIHEEKVFDMDAFFKRTIRLFNKNAEYLDQSAVEPLVDLFANIYDALEEHELGNDFWQLLEERLQKTENEA